MLEAKDQRHKGHVFSKKKGLKFFFRATSKKKNGLEDAEFSQKIKRSQKTKKVFANFPPGFCRFL